MPVLPTLLADEAEGEDELKGGPTGIIARLEGGPAGGGVFELKAALVELETNVEEGISATSSADGMPGVPVAVGRGMVIVVTRTRFEGIGVGTGISVGGGLADEELDAEDEGDTTGAAGAAGGASGKVTAFVGPGGGVDVDVELATKDDDAGAGEELAGTAGAED